MSSQSALDRVETTQRIVQHHLTTIEDMTSLRYIREWLVEVISPILALLCLAITEFAARLAALEAPSASTAASAGTSASTAGATCATSTAPSAPRSSSRPTRCTNCHARGHLASDCRTTNPSAMRKRVARNSQLARSARTLRSPPYASANMAAPPTFPLLGYPPPYAVPNPMVANALVADATELRRRSAQSARDKRIRRQQPSQS